MDEPPLSRIEAESLLREWGRIKTPVGRMVTGWFREWLNPPRRKDGSMSLKEARAIAGPLSYSRKMPGPSWGIPVETCPTGAKLAGIPGSVCSLCNMKRGQVAWPNAIRAQRKRLAAFSDPRWESAIVTQIRHACSAPRFINLGRRGEARDRLGRDELREMDAFRIFDVGDLQSVGMLRDWCEIAEVMPEILFWMETKELGMLRYFVQHGGRIPRNMIMRVSAILIDDPHPRRNWTWTSSVFTREPPPGAFVCEAHARGNRCGSCRACWKREVAHIAHPYQGSRIP